MSVKLSTSSVNGAENDINILVSDKLVQDIWVDLAGAVTREHVYKIATEVAREYKDAKVTTFLPILIRRQTLARLEAAGQEGE